MAIQRIRNPNTGQWDLVGGAGGGSDADLTDTPLYVNHGTDATYARPDTTRPVVWRGTVSPNNMIDGDDYLDLSGTFAIHGGTP